jgi:hypothetical protein
MCSRELSFDLLPSPFCSLNRSSGEVAVSPGFFDKLHDPLSAVILRDFTTRESVRKIAMEGLAFSYHSWIMDYDHTR